MPLGREGANESNSVSAEEATNFVKTSIPQDLQIPIEDATDFRVSVRSSVLRRARSRLEAMKEQKFDFSNILLVGVGAFSGAVISIEAGTNTVRDGLYMFLVLSGFVCLLSYVVLQLKSYYEKKYGAAEILSDLPDPDKTRKLQGDEVTSDES